MTTVETIFKLTKKGNVKELDSSGSVVAKYTAMPYTTCEACAFISYKNCGGIPCSAACRSDCSIDNVHFVLKIKKPKSGETTITAADYIKGVLMAAGLIESDATRAGELITKDKDHTLEWAKGKRLENLLWYGFIWARSEEGHSYWKEIAKQLGAKE